MDRAPTNRHPATFPAIAVALLAPFLPVAADAVEIRLRLMETTDLHVLDFDCYRDVGFDDVGLSRTATLIREASEEADNSLLFDNGDLIQGNPMGD